MVVAVNLSVKLLPVNSKENYGNYQMAGNCTHYNLDVLPTVHCNSASALKSEASIKIPNFVALAVRQLANEYDDDVDDDRK